MSEAVQQFNLLQINMMKLSVAAYIIIIVNDKENNMNLEISKLAQNDCSSNGCEYCRELLSKLQDFLMTLYFL